MAKRGRKKPNGQGLESVRTGGRSGPSTKRPQEQAAAAEKALLVVAQSGLSWTDAAELQRTSLVLCEACRRCIPVRMRVGANTPRAVWARTDVVGGGGGISGGGGLDSRCERGGGTGSGGGRRTCGVGGSGDDSDWRGIAANSKSRKLKGKRQRREQGQQQQQLQPQPNQQQQTGEAERRIAPRLMRQLRILSLVWEAPAIHLGDGSGLPAELTELTFCRDFNRPLSGIQWPPKLARLTFGSKFNRHLSAEVGCRPGLPGRQRVPGSKLPPSGAAGACGGSGSDSAANRCHDDGGHNRKTRDKCAPRDTADTGEGDAAIDDSRMDHHGTDHHHRHHHRSDLRHGSDHHGKRGTQSELSLLPGSLKDLTLGKQFNKPLPRSSLPPGLVSLTLGRNFHHHGSVRDAVWPSGLKVIRFGEAMLKRLSRDEPLLEAMRGVPLSSSSYPSSSSDPSQTTKTKEAFAWPAGLERVEFWQEGRAIVTLKGGRYLDPESAKWLWRN